MTKIILAEKIDENSFFIDALYYPSTSYSKSLEPTLSRAFTKYARELVQGGNFKSTSLDIAIGNKGINHSTKPYFIRRVTYTRI